MPTTRGSPGRSRRNIAVGIGKFWNQSEFEPTQALQIWEGIFWFLVYTACLLYTSRRKSMGDVEQRGMGRVLLLG